MGVAAIKTNVFFVFLETFKRMKGHLCVFEGVCVCVCVCFSFVFDREFKSEHKFPVCLHSLTHSLTRVCYGVVAQGSISPTCYKQLFVQKCFVQIFVYLQSVLVFFCRK